jgi:hypothetical protein
LEERLLLYSSTGGAWSKPARITYSFAPDGTNVGGDSSNLLATMASRGFSTANWQAQFAKAAAVWQAVTGINFAQVSDDGSAFGTSGDQQGDPRFGDIRIGGDSLGQGVLGAAFFPPPLNGGTLAGDIIISSNVAWQIDNDYDLETVAIHEIGHALGLDHSTIASADLYAAYNSMKQSLSSDDTQGIQSIYGARPQDAYDASGSNNTATTADDITPRLNAQGTAAIASLDITTACDVDYYKVTVPACTSGTLTVAMQSSNLSLLSPKLAVFNASMQTLGSAGAANSFSNTATLTVNGVSAGQLLYIKCSAANTGPGGNGGYGLSLSFGANTTSVIAAPNTTVAAQPSTSASSADQTASSSGGGLLGGLGGLVQNVVKDVVYVVGGLLHIGSLTGAGDLLTTREFAQTQHHDQETPSDSSDNGPVIIAPPDGATGKGRHGFAQNHHHGNHPRPVTSGSHGDRMRPTVATPGRTNPHSP